MAHRVVPLVRTEEEGKSVIPPHRASLTSSTDAEIWEPAHEHSSDSPVVRMDSPGGDDHDDVQDVDMDAPGEKPAGKRPDFGPQANVHDGSVTTLIYSANGSLAASGSEDTCVIIWDVAGNNAPKRLEGHGDTVSTLAFPRDNRALACASQDERIFIWDVVRVEKLKELTPSSAVHSLVYTPDGSKLIAGASDGKLYIWDSTTYSLEKVLKKNTAVVKFTVFLHDRQRMATGGTESVCYIWETAKLDAPNPER